MSKIIGYCRVSTRSQNIERQERNIKAEYPDAVIVKEAYTGTKIEGRKEFEKILAKIKKGDTIIFDSVSRMSRNAEEGTALYFELYNKGINLVFLKERHIDTDSYKKALDGIVSVDIKTGTKATDKLVKSVLDAVNEFMFTKIQDDIKKAFEQAEKEVKDIRQRVKEGQLTARLNGKEIGLKEGTKLITKKSEQAKEQIKKYSKDFNGTNLDKDVMKLIEITDKFGNVKKGIAKNSYYKYKAELFAELSK